MTLCDTFEVVRDNNYQSFSSLFY